MGDVWEGVFAKQKLMWGREPTAAATFAAERFAQEGLQRVLIPGVGYGRNARPFLDRGMSVTGIEVSETAIALARSELHLDIPIHHGSVTAMPFDQELYDGIFCYGLLYLLDPGERAKVLGDCWRQLRAGGEMIFTLVSKSFDSYGKGTKLGEDWYETNPGVRIYFYDEASIRREFADFGLTEVRSIDEPMHGSARPFWNAICQKL